MTMLVLTSGKFGRAVADRICQQTEAQVADLPDDPSDLDALVPEGGMVAVATWRPHLAQCERLDDLCFERGTRFSLAELYGERLTSGPLIVPGSGPCYHCYRRRWNVHHPAPQRELVLENAYRRDATVGATGYLPPMVAIGAAGLIEDARAETSEAGRFRVVDVLSNTVLESFTIGVHRCRRCRPEGEKLTGARFVEHMAPVIERMAL